MSIITEALKKAQYKTVGEKSPTEEKSLFVKERIRKSKIERGSLIAISAVALPVIFLSVGLALIHTRNAARPVEIVGEKETPPPLAKPDRDTAKIEPLEALEVEQREFESNYSAVKSDYSAVQAKPDFEINLSGIMYTPKRPLAVINDRIVTEGERIGSFKIIRIDRDRVVLNAGDGSELEVPLRR